MGLRDIIKTPTVETAPAPDVGVSISLDDLVAEESAARAALDPPAPRPLPATEAFAMGLGVINASPLGFPKLVGRAAIMFGTLNKHDLKAGMEIPATGKLAKLPPIEDPEGVVKLAEEIERKLPKKPLPSEMPVTKKVERVEPAIAILPPDAPPSNPAIAALPVEGLDNAKARELASLTITDIPGLAETVAAANVMSSAAPDLFGGAAVNTIDVAPAPAAPEPASVPAVPAIEPPPADKPAEAARPTRGRPPGSKTKKKDKPADATATVTASTIEDKPVGTELQVYDDHAIHIFLDAVCENVEGLTPLDTYVRHLCATLEAEFKVADVRCASKDSPLGYDKWRGAVAALARRHPPAPGVYALDTRGNEIGEIIAVALKTAVIESGGMFVRGAR